MKTVYGDFITNNGESLNLCEISEDARTWKDPIHYITQYYE